MKKVCFGLALILSISAFAQTDARLRKIDSLLTFLSSKNKFMGSLALREGNNLIFAKAYGFSDVDARKNANENTKYKIGSITKIFTSAIVMQLAEENKLRLDDKISRFFPKIKNADKISIEMLLRHRSGIHEILSDSVTARNIGRKHNREQIVDRISGFNSDFEPDAKFEYSNSNFILLGFIIEDVTKKSYSENLQKRIVQKAGLTNTYLPESINVTQNEAVSAIYNGKNWEVTPEWSNSLAFSAGAIASTPSDLTAFMKALFDNEIASRASVEKMKVMKENYGLGLSVLPYGVMIFYGHTGRIEDFHSVVGYTQVSQFGFSLCVNGDNYDSNTIMLAVLDIYYGKEYKFPDLNGFAVSAQTLQKYVGTYATPSFPMKISFFIEDGKFMSQAQGQSAFVLEAKSETKFEFAPAGISIEFYDGKMNLKQAGLNLDFTKE